MDRMMLKFLFGALFLEAAFSVLSALSSVYALMRDAHLLSGIDAWGLIDVLYTPVFAITYALLAIAALYWIPRLLTVLVLEREHAT